ncbi:uncharacterized protein CC84DRAFT_645359 [Paraphaeosphaeria sporulosa]|uniref:Uncharacterized protein n=1 Tax=Paraphaeosphaeria sporulosa TaxID=1460663 RepID=A0A177CJT9_9PLEO|nr:uncharacterized protein CC84DRAFT_645359 [Paraphaeosphaeria sporulosa]OAG07242.1 hypothetical protein CC84DRAFT_645359 [Paraphaeosphaeria sporulosa]
MCGITPLAVATKSGHECAVRFLIESGADVDFSAWWSEQRDLSQHVYGGRVREPESRSMQGAGMQISNYNPVSSWHGGFSQRVVKGVGL